MAQEFHKRQGDLRIVVLGYIRSGKTATINTILRDRQPNQEQVTHCVRREGVFEGRSVTLIDTAGWWKLYPLSQTTVCIKRELVLSMSLCQPGPHAILLVIELDSPFSSTEEKSVREHCEHLGSNIWDHTIVLFTKGDLIVDTAIEEHIKHQGQALEGLVQRCGGRYHVFDNNQSICDQSQVRELFDKVDQLTASNHGRPFEVDRMFLKQTKEAKKADKDRALAYNKSVTEQRKQINTCGDVQSLPEMRILLVGWMLSGKSYTADTILNGDHFFPGKVTEKATCAQGEVLGRCIKVVDTPGWWKFLPSKYTPARVKEELRRGLTLCGKYPHAVLLTVTAEVSFHEEQRQIIQDNLETFLGKDVWRHVIVVFTFGYLLKETSIEEVIESQGRALRWLVQKCGNRYHVLSKRSQDNDGQVRGLVEKIEEMVAGNCVFCPGEEAKRCEEAGEEKRCDRSTDVDTVRDIDIDRGSETDDTCVEDVINTLDKEWLRTDERMIEEVQKKWIATIELAHRKQKSNRSMQEPIRMQKEEESMDMQEEKDQRMIHDKATQADNCHDDESDVSLRRQQSNDDEALSVHLKDLLECEWRRRDYIIKEIVREAVQELKGCFGNPSEPDQREVNQSRDKVAGWLQTINTSDYGSSSHLSEPPAE